MATRVSRFLILLSLICSIVIEDCQSVRCYTESCNASEDPSCLTEQESCVGDICYLDSTGHGANLKRIARGCLDREFLKNEGDGCFLISAEEHRRYFCQCREDFCNARVDFDAVKTVGDGRNVSCETGCGGGGRLKSTTVVGRGGRRRKLKGRKAASVGETCKGRTDGGPFCSYDPQNRGSPMSEYGRSYYTPFGSFYGWPSADSNGNTSTTSTVCIRYTFPPFYFIRDASCFCDSNNCHRTRPAAAHQSLLDSDERVVTCHGCFLDCNGVVGEFCGTQDTICHNDTTCRGHYCVSHSVVDRRTSDETGRLAVLSQYCMNSTKRLNGSWHEMNFDSGRNGRTRVIVCNGRDYCNWFNFTGLVVGEQPESNSTSGYNVRSSPSMGRMMKLRRLLNYLLESLLSPNGPW